MVTMMMMTASQTCNNWVDQCNVLGFSRNFSDAALQTALITVCHNTIRVQKWWWTEQYIRVPQWIVPWHGTESQFYRCTAVQNALYRCTVVQKLYQNCSVVENALYRGPVRGKVLDIPSFIISYKLILPYFLLFIISSLIIWRGFLVNVIFNMCMSQTPKYAIGIGCDFFALLAPSGALVVIMV